MSIKRNWKAWVALSVVVAVVAVSGGVTMASNVGFKINKALYRGAAPPTGDNLISLPYNNSYTTARLLCNAIGAGGLAGVRVLTRTPGGATTTSFCSATPGHTLISGANPASRAHIVRVSCVLGAAGCLAVASPGPPAAASGILVGSSNETQVLPSIVRGGVDNDVSIPYHTTAVGAKDVCNMYAGFTTASQRVLRLNAATGAFTTFFCSAGPPGFTLVIGEGVIIRNTLTGAADPGTLPPHF